jgi:hypothetical protein
VMFRVGFVWDGLCEKSHSSLLLACSPPREPAISETIL